TADGDFTVDVYLENVSESTVVEGQVLSMDGKLLGDAFQLEIAEKSEKVTLHRSFDNPKSWSPEFPNLYQVELRLKDRNGEGHVIRQRFGFRTVELRSKDGIYVNGQKVKFKGV